MNPLRQALEEYLAVRRALGFKLCDSGRTLHQFVDFAEARGAFFITTELALHWARQPSQADPVRWAQRLGSVRLFARHCTGLDPRTEVPPKGLLACKFRRKPPYLYSDTEIVRLLAATQRLRSRTGLRPATFATLLGLMAVTGMRTCEPIGLDRADVDLTHGVITIRQSKFGKSRCLPVAPSTQRALELYQLRRDRLCPHSRTPAFFVTEHGRRVHKETLRWTFVKLSHQIGLRKPLDRRGPRLHDLRHYPERRIIPRWRCSAAELCLGRPSDAG